MIDLSRRETLLGAAGAAMLGLAGPVAFLPAAHAADVRKKGYYSYKVGGDIEVISLYDGIWKKPHDENFIKGVTVDETKAALKKGGLAEDHVPIEFAFTVVKAGGKTILIDAGTGGQLAPTAGLASAGMKAAGLKPEDIDTLLITHMHPDHIFGLMAKDTNAQIFPNAEIILGETEYGFWTDPGLIEKLPEGRRGLAQRIQATFPKWKNVTRFSGEKEVVPGIRAVETPGHTPGHTAYHISSGNDQLMVIGDMVALPALFLANIDWQFAFDGDKDQATATRKKVVERVIVDNIAVAGYHFGFPNSGKIEKDGKGYAFVPTSA